MPDQLSAYQPCKTPAPSTRPSLCPSSPGMRPATQCALPQGGKGRGGRACSRNPSHSQHLNLASLCICPSDLRAALSSSLQNKPCSLFKPGPSGKPSRALERAPGLSPGPDPTTSCNLGHGVSAQPWTSDVGGEPGGWSFDGLDQPVTCQLGSLG